jgi:hypothetical protein
MYGHIQYLYCWAPSGSSEGPLEEIIAVKEDIGGNVPFSGIIWGGGGLRGITNKIVKKNVKINFKKILNNVKNTRRILYKH